MEPGIYIAVSEQHPEKKFIFSAVDGWETWKIHFDILMKGKHTNKRLQDHFKQNPTDTFSVRVLFACNKNEMVHYTLHFINVMKPFFNQKSKAKK